MCCCRPGAVHFASCWMSLCAGCLVYFHGTAPPISAATMQAKGCARCVSCGDGLCCVTACMLLLCEQPSSPGRWVLILVVASTNPSSQGHLDVEGVGCAAVGLVLCIWLLMDVALCASCLVRFQGTVRPISEAAMQVSVLCVVQLLRALRGAAHSPLLLCEQPSGPGSLLKALVSSGQAPPQAARATWLLRALGVLLQAWCCAFSWILLRVLGCLVRSQGTALPIIEATMQVGLYVWVCCCGCVLLCIAACMLLLFG